jgi:predicted MPP superfamily phosphohydrolase
MFFVVTFFLAIIPVCVFYAWSVASLPWIARRRRALAVALAAMCFAGAPLQWLVVHTHSVWIMGVQTMLGMVFVTLGLGAIPLLAIHLACVYGRRRSSAPPPALRAPQGPEGGPDGGPDETPREYAAGRETIPLAAAASKAASMTRRQVVEASAGAALFGAVGAAVGWGVVRGRHAFALREIAVRVAGLPRALDGYVIAQISDIHTGIHVGERELEEGLSILRRTSPDLVVVTGDLVDIDPAFAPFVARKLADLPSRDGVFACLGNHDYYAGARAVTNTLRAAGVTPLVNDGRVLRAGDGGGFALLGVDDLTSKRYPGGAGPRLDLALAAVPPGLPRILLSHQPPTVDMWAGQVALQLSGHTHGGQINPGGRMLNMFFEYVAGIYEVGGTTLYVNRGFGTVGPPARIGVPPEVTRIVLIAA